MRSTTVQSERLPLRLQQQIDACCDQFESALQKGDAPEVSELLNGISPEAHIHLRRELAAIELAYQRTKAHHDTDGLHLRCPHCQNHVELLPEAKLEEITCNSCGDTFSLIDDEEQLGENGLRRVGHFELLARLGTGGFGSVWEARDTELDRLVALKLPRKSQLSAREAEQFFREARTAAQLRHPNIVPVHEVGKEGGTIYIVTDLIRGVTLSDSLKEARPTAADTAQLCATIAEALDYAHSRGVIHRDLKPSNVMLDQARQPYIMDFGLAKRELGEITMTVDGTVLGTPAYMSPEQAQGQLHWVDRRTDIYSLGIMLFQMLTGELPYRGTAQQQIQQRIVDDAPDPRKLNSHIPADLATICLKCIEREATKRFASADAVAAELRRYLAGEPIKSRPISSINRSFRWAKRNPAKATAAALICFLAVAGPMAAATIYHDKQMIEQKAAEVDRQLEENVQDANAARRRLGAVEKKLKGIVDANPGIEELSDWHQRLIAEVIEANQKTRDQLLEPETTTSAFGLLTKARLHLGWAYLLNATGQHADAARNAESARDNLVSLLAQEPNSVSLQMQLAEALTQLSVAQESAGDSRSAESSMSKALELRTSLAQTNPKTLKYQLDQLHAAGMQLGIEKSVTEKGKKTAAASDWLALRRELSDKLVVDATDFYTLACYLTQHEPHLASELAPVAAGHALEEGEVD